VAHLSSQGSSRNTWCSGCRAEDLEESFAVVLNNSKGESLGITVNRTLENNLAVQAIRSEGLIAEWNKRFPDYEIQVGDSIVDVNGVSGDRQAMMTRMRSDVDLSLTILRSGSMVKSIDTEILNFGDKFRIAQIVKDWCELVAEARYYCREFEPYIECYTAFGEPVDVDSFATVQESQFPLTVRLLGAAKVEKRCFKQSKTDPYLFGPPQTKQDGKKSTRT